MARKRMLDPGIWTNVQIARLTVLQRLLYIGLISNADDEGRLNGEPMYIKGTIFPHDTITLTTIDEAIKRVSQQNLIILYEVNGNKYIQHPNWNKWQYIKARRPSMLPPPPEWASTTPILPQRYPNATPTIPLNPKEEKGKGKKILCLECKGTGEVGNPGYQRKCPTCKGNKLVWREDAELLR